MQKKFAYRIFNQENESILAITDLSLLGKSFEEGELCLDITEQFYHDSECDEEHAILLARKATIINAVGKLIISVLIKENMVDKKNILDVSGIPHAQIFRI